MKTAPSSAPAAAVPFGGAGRSIRDALANGIGRLQEAHVSAAALSAELLLFHVLGRDRAWFYTHPEYALSALEESHYVRLIEQRAAGTPTQHLTGRQEFWGLEFEVTPDVLIPRPETEHIVEVALARLADRLSPRRIADVGTGSGCLAVALAHEWPLAQVVATDTSAAALGVARRNAERHGVGGRIEFAQTNLLDPYLADSADARGRFDLIVSNPPYIARGEAAHLEREVREHEPPEALFGGETGVEMYPPLIAQAETLLVDGGLFVAELGYDSAERVRSLLDDPTWSGIAITNDLAGIPRILSAERSR